MEPRTPSDRDDLRETIEIRRRMQANRLREASYVPRSTSRSRARASSGRVIISPAGMAHLEDRADSLRPICIHFEKGKTEGWEASGAEWNALSGIPRCRTCLELS